MVDQWVQECRAPGRRPSSLHMDVRFLASPEPIDPSTNAVYDEHVLTGIF